MQASALGDREAEEKKLTCFEERRVVLVEERVSLQQILFQEVAAIIGENTKKLEALEKVVQTMLEVKVPRYVRIQSILALVVWLCVLAMPATSLGGLSVNLKAHNGTDAAVFQAVKLLNGYNFTKTIYDLSQAVLKCLGFQAN
mmetsp:Transcript_2883/g.4953  ORF Transcript_2883/g.4953 Transcript_2883/m.4953 type:complete len:143 (+) Transcript_2883:179-607(+)